ncbi:MAG: hypothetical protein WCK33_05395 [Phycisphaerae bacterium]
MTLLQTHVEVPATIVTLTPARPTSIRFHEAAPAALPFPGRPAPTPSLASGRRSSSSAAAALDLALDRMIDQAARELRVQRQKR